MTQEERKNIRMRTEKECIAFPTRRSTVIHRDTIFSLLDDLDETGATITDKDAEIARLLDKLETLESHYNLARHHYHLVSEVRDRQIALVKALERAIKKLPHKALNAACYICKYQAKENELSCGNPNGGCKNGNYVGWQFDEPQFSGKVVQHE